MIVDESLYCYVRDLNTGDRIAFNCERPTGFTDSYSANYESQSVRGRSSPFQAYNSSGPRTVSFEVKLTLDYNRDLVDKVNSLRDMLKPYKLTMIRSPRVQVVIGEVLNITAVPTSFTASWSDGYIEGVYRVCTIQLSFTEVEDTSSFDTQKQSETSSSEYVGDNIEQEETDETRLEWSYVNLQQNTYGFVTYDGALKAERDADYTQGVGVLAGQYEAIERRGNIYKIYYYPDKANYWVSTVTSDLSYADFIVQKIRYPFYGYTSQHDAQYQTLSDNQGEKRYELSNGSYKIKQVKGLTRLIDTEYGDLWVKEGNNIDD